MDFISLACNNYNSRLINSLDHFKACDSFVDVTLVCEGYTVKAHRIVLSAGSNLLCRLMLSNPAKHPIIILAETKFDTLKMIIDFLYKGRIDIPRNDLNKVLQVATTFEINDLKQLCEENLNSEPNLHSCLSSPDLSASSPKKKRQRRLSPDSDILFDTSVLKRENDFSSYRLQESEAFPFTETSSINAQAELVEFHSQLTEARSVLITSVESSVERDSIGPSIQKINKDASTECDIQPLKELKCNCAPIKSARIKPRCNEITDSLLNKAPITSAIQLASLNRLLQSIGKLQSEMMVINKKVETLLSNFTSRDFSNVFPKPLPREIKLPIDCDEDLITLNNKLQDTQLLSTLINYLHAEGRGKSVRSFVSSIIKKVLSQKVAMLYSRLGRKGKKCFMNLELILKAILTAVSLKFPNKSEEEIAVIFGKALTAATDWEGRNDSSLAENKNK